MNRARLLVAAIATAAALIVPTAASAQTPGAPLSSSTTTSTDLQSTLLKSYQLQTTVLDQQIKAKLEAMRAKGATQLDTIQLQALVNKRNQVVEMLSTAVANLSRIQDQTRRNLG